MTPTDKHRTAANEQTPRTKGLQDKLNGDLRPLSQVERQDLMWEAAAELGKLERELSTANARLERLRELARAVLDGGEGSYQTREDALRAELGEG